MTCNRIDKVPGYIQSRFNCVPVYPINKDESDWLFQNYVQYVGMILSKLNISYETDVLNEFVNIDNLIQKISSNDSWGTLPGNAIDAIKKSIEPKFNYKALFQQFRSIIVSSKYDKTRMRPNRRFGYTAMGTKRKNTTHKFA